MTRAILDESQIHPAARPLIGGKHADLVREVQAAIAANQVVVVGMAINPFPRKARKILDVLGTPYQYLQYGSYFNQWHRRNALKMWSGWPTFPMVFVNGVLVGGASELQALVTSGELSTMLAKKCASFKRSGAMYDRQAWPGPAEWRSVLPALPARRA